MQFIGILLCKIDRFLDEGSHLIDIETELCFDDLSLGLLSCKWIADQAEFEREMVRSLWNFCLHPLLVVDFDDLLDGVT